jgi:cytochrome b6-f complex iron-sulfur subunit
LFSGLAIALAVVAYVVITRKKKSDTDSASNTQDTQEDITTPGGGNTGGNNTGGNTTNSFKVDLTKDLQAVGSFIFNDKIIVVRLATGSVPSSFVAIQRACTHQGTEVNWNASKNEFICPNHGARFNTSGQNIGGQSTGALPVYAISISGTTLSVG